MIQVCPKAEPSPPWIQPSSPNKNNSHISTVCLHPGLIYKGWCAGLQSWDVSKAVHSFWPDPGLLESPFPWFTAAPFSLCLRIEVFTYSHNLCICAQSLQLRLTLWDPVDCSPPGSSIHGVLQARALKWVAMPFTGGSSWPRDRTCISYISCIGRRVLYHEHHLGSPSAQPIRCPMFLPL